jgi:hypothetical protein
MERNVQERAHPPAFVEERGACPECRIRVHRDVLQPQEGIQRRLGYRSPAEYESEFDKERPVAE